MAASSSSTNDDDGHVHLTAECLCKTHKFTTTVPHTALPLQATTCHCDSCRRFTGALYSIDAPWAGDPETIRQSTLQWYDFSANLKILFCGTCSAPMFWDSPKRDPDTGASVGRKFTVFVGALSNDSGAGRKDGQGLVEVGTHMFIGDTKDGGASMWMRGMNGEQAVPVKRFKEMKHESEELAGDWPGAEYLAEAQKQEAQDEVPIRCHCGGVDLVFLRKEAEREWTAKEASELPRIVDPVSRKYVAGLDACDSCRLSFGSDFASWTFLFLRHIGFPTGKEEASSNDDGSGNNDASPKFPETLQDLYTAVSEGKMGTLAVYRSSGHIKRYFCSRCSASVFYTGENRKNPNIVDLTLGVLHADEGARAESSFHWRLGGPMQHRQDMADGWRGTWLEAVEAEAESWRKERGMPKWWLESK